MNRFKSGKKIFSAIAALAISATAVGGILASVNKNSKSTIDSSSGENKTVALSTALGEASSQLGNKYYVSPTATPNNPNAAGTMEDPFNIIDVLVREEPVKKLEAGDTLYVIPGTYNIVSKLFMDRSVMIGEYNKYIRVVNAALEKSESGYNGSETQAVLNFSGMTFDSTNRGISIDTDYVYWYGVDICGAGDNGMYIGGSYNTIEYCEFYNNRDTGLQLGRSYSEYNSIYQWPSYNLIKNCTSHNNYDNETFGENADGFAAKLTVGFGNVFDGCIAYRNSDDGWDLYAKTDSGNIGTVIIYNCVAFENGYLEYTRDECNSLFPEYNKSMDYHTGEKSVNPYMTRDGDGNGFKLGGSIMEGDVVLYNCLAYNNRMHGVTDNSNPGYIKTSYVTSYNNSAMIDMNGNVTAAENVDTHSNIDVSRQTYSYNSVNHVLSVRDSDAKSLDSDNYRGTVLNSLLDAGSKTNVIQGSIDGDTINGKKTYTSQTDLLVASDMFAELPNKAGTLKGNGDSMAIANGAISSMNGSRVHLTRRNADHSINMGAILDKKDTAESTISGLLGAGVTCGSDLNLASWDAYVHFYQNDLVNGNAQSEDMVWVERAKEALTINTVEDAVYQDFQVPVKMLNVDISWESSDDNYVVVKDDEEEIEISSSGSEYALIEVWRDQTADKQVTLTATITKGEASATKEFVLTLKQGTSSIGSLYVEDSYDYVIADGEKHVVDLYTYYPEPKLKVQNGLYPDSNKLLRDTEYDVKTTYMYQTNGNAHPNEVKLFTPSVAGVFTITHEVTLKGSSSAPIKMSYKLYVASPDATVEFIGAADVTATRDGFAISGDPSSATGILYAVSSAEPLDITDETVGNIKTLAGVESYSFRDTHISFNFTNENKASYYVYYALANANGEITSQLHESTIQRVDISNTDDFKKLAVDGKLNDDDVPSRTIYALTENLDFSGVSFSAGSKTFSGVFNGLGHTISNLSTTGKGIFYKINGGTIMNVKFDNLSINYSGADNKVGFVIECLGGDFYNIAFTNYSVSSSVQRVGGLIGHVGDSKGEGCDLTISQVSIVNDADHKISGSQRVGGLIGFVQAYGHNINIDNCYVVSEIEASTTGEGGGMVGTWEDRSADTLTISQCYYSGLLKTSAAPGSSRLGGMLGYHKGGAGVLTITRCLSLAKFNIANVDRDVSVKNASPIVGNFSSSQNTVVSVTYCIGLMEEYNTDFDVQAFSDTNLRRHDEYITGAEYLNLDLTRWTIVAAEGGGRDLYKAPYVTLNFLGDWAE